MKNLWDEKKTLNFRSDIDFRVYTSNLLGLSDELVLHGGGNTSVKTLVDGESILYVKGSGWDLVSIKKEGFAPVKMQALLEMAQLQTLSDSDMVSAQKAAMIDTSAPNPSVEAILHALIPYKFVDHTHADAIVTISNSINGKDLIKDIFPDFLIIPYVMPGFLLAKTIFEMTIDFDWSSCEGIILHHHGIFTFDDDAKKSYDKMIEAVSKAENFLEKNTKIEITQNISSTTFDTSVLQELLSVAKGYEVCLHVNTSDIAKFYSSHADLETFATRGVLTPEHIIRTKRTPLVLENSDIHSSLESYIQAYKKYFNTFATNQICLNPAPNYIVIKNFGVISVGKNEKEASIINDIIEHTMLAVLKADQLGGYQSISLKDSFEMEYWELEQAKLRK